MIPSIELIRLEENFEFGTFGIWRINKEIFCVTLEPRNEENETNISSIPAQQYICKLKPTNLSSVRNLGFIETYEVMDVPDRYGVKIHPGNTVDDTLGCILLAEKFGKLYKDRAILNSGQTFKNFMELMREYPEFILTIKEDY